MCYKKPKSSINVEEQDDLDEIREIWRKEELEVEKFLLPYKYRAAQHAPANINLIKQWGKNFTNKFTPLNRTISINQELNKLGTITRVTLQSINRYNILQIDNKQVEISRKMKNMLFEIKKLQPDLYKYSITIESRNFHPYGANLNSNTSLFASMIGCFVQLFNISYKNHLKLLGLGAGNSIKSLCNGFCIRNCDGYCEQLDQQWNELCIVVCLLNIKKEEVEGTEGMKKSAETSSFFYKRLDKIDEKFNNMIKYIKDKNFHFFSDLLMKESNEIRAVMLDSLPPINQLTDESFKIIKFVHWINEYYKKITSIYAENNNINIDCDENIVAQTFDTSCHPVLFTLDKYLTIVKKLLCFCNVLNSQELFEKDDQWFFHQAIDDVKDTITNNFSLDSIEMSIVISKIGTRGKIEDANSYFPEIALI